MTIKGHAIKKTISRSSIVFVLVISIILSSISITFAKSEGSLTTPETLIESHPQTQAFPERGPTQMRQYLNGLYDNTYNIATMWTHYYNDSLREGLFLLMSKGHILVLPDNNQYGVSFGVYSNVPHDELKFTWYAYGSFGGTPTYYTSRTPVTIEGYGTFYRCGDSTLYNYMNFSDAVYYCNDVIGFPVENVFAVENLDVTAYLPNPYIFNAIYNEELSNIRCEVNFNPRVYSSFVTVWGYNELGSILYIYGSDEYNVWFGDEQDTEPETYFFYLDINAITSAYIGTDFHISSISCMGWEDAHEEFLSVDWNFSSEKEPGEYNPPDSNYYYTSYYNENYHYAEQNGNVVAFGNVDICLYSDQNLDRVFWDKQKTLLTPYKYSYVFLPASITNTIGVGYYNLLDQLILEFDIVINNCPTDVFNAMYGQGAEADFLSVTTVGGMIQWFNTHFRYYDLIPYSYFDNLPSENYQSYDCTCFYTDSFYFKSLAYLLGDSNERLLEFESRLLGEDGAWQSLLSSLKSIYDTNFEYQKDMLTYMSKLNYLTELIIRRDYFEQYLFHLGSIDDKLSDIKNALVGTNEEDFDNDLHAPWLEIYRYFKNLFNRSLIKLPDFLNTTSEILDGGSNQVGIGFTLDNDYEQALPLNSPSVTPTPIPIPTLFP